ncbi:hypothetical protein FQN50_004152 [Emmonsiellopsis sp. PD_5]|nr:hypothetical protein FQN50_004152 [Emmonsiellopsis sp. PD_5]
MPQIQPIWSRFVRFEAEDGKIYGGQPVDENQDVGLASLTPSTTPILVKVLDSSSPLALDAKFTGETVVAKRILSPLTEEQVGTIRCVGLNYHDHGVSEQSIRLIRPLVLGHSRRRKPVGGIYMNTSELKTPTLQAELHFDIPSDPAIFLKPSTTLSGPTTPITIPKTLTGIDFEVELAVIIGRTCKNATLDNALDYVLGYTVSNDVSARGVQFQTSQFCYAKGFDGFAPLGPVIVSGGGIPDPQVMEVRTVLNGEVMQKSNTANMIFSVRQIVAHLSRGSTLPAGTVIMTGTPGGIGHSRTPPVYLKEGDELRISISHGLGTLVNPIVDEKDDSS